jgi:hypothetical protein
LEPWSPRVATEELGSIAQRADLTLAYKLHAREQMSERAIIASDVLFVLKHAFVLTEAVPATRAEFFRYAIENKSPNSNGRDIRRIVIPDKKRCIIKLVTVMWVDETAKRAGSIIG